MVYSLYISYSEKDSHFINYLYSILKQIGIDVYTSTIELPRNQLFIDKNKTMINTSDIILVYLTKNSIDSQNLYIDIGMIRTCNKSPILIIDSDIEIPDNLKEYSYYKIDKNNPKNTLNNIQIYLTSLKNKKESDNAATALIFFLGALALVLAASEE